MAEDGEKPKDAKAAADEPLRYHRDRLIAEGEAFFGQPRYVIEGALSMSTPANKQHFTRDEADRLIKKYLDHEVEIDHPTVEGA